MNRLFFKSILLLFMLSVIGCVAAPINQHNAKSYAESGFMAIQSGDWKFARRQWGRAIYNADLGFMDKKERAVYYYEYGRTLGVTCAFDEAEEYLNKSYELDLQTGGPAFMSLVELFRLKLDQKRYQEAVDYFEKALPELEKVNAPEKSGIEFSKLLKEYAVALNGIGRLEEAKKTVERAALYEKSGQESVTERTPYGLHCN